MAASETDSIDGGFKSLHLSDSAESKSVGAGGGAAGGAGGAGGTVTRWPSWYKEASWVAMDVNEGELPRLHAQVSSDEMMQQITTGMVRAEKFVRDDACEPAKAPATLLLGQKGSGKTTRLKLLAMRRSVRVTNSFNVYVDMSAENVDCLAAFLWKNFQQWWTRVGTKDIGAMPTRQLTEEISLMGVVERICELSESPPLLILHEIHDVYKRDVGEGKELIKQLVLLGGQCKCVTVIWQRCSHAFAGIRRAVANRQDCE